MRGGLTRYDDDGDEKRLDLVPYVEAPLRRPWLVLGTLIAVTALAVGTSFLLPKRYQTSTLILVESQKVPESVLREDVEGRGPRLQTIRQEILSRTRLERVIQELDPYPGRHASATEVVDAMRGAIEISVKGNDAFSIDYTHRDPQKAQQVANRLATLFIEETSQTREAQAAGATEFLDSQLQDARKELEAKELAIRRYKEARMGRLPEQTTANLATLQRLQMEDQTVAEGLRAARARLRELEAGQPAPRPAAGDGRGSAAPDPATELAQMKAQLAALRARYTDEHPDVRSLRDRIAQQERQQADTAPGTAGADLRRAEVEEAKRDLADLEAKKAQVEGRMFAFQNRVEDTPRTEQELATLTRDYQKINENYLELLKKKMDAQMAQRLEQRWKGEQFRVLDPAYLPERPVFPKRSLFLVGGLVGGLVLGLALALLIEVLQPGVRSLHQLEARMPYPVLASFPRMGAEEGLVARLARRMMRGAPAAARAGERR